MAAGEPLLPTIVEPARPKSTLMEKGLSWQETFDFGNGGAEAFQLPPVGLLQAPSATELKRTRVELQDNAETLRRKLADFEVDGRIVQVSPGPMRDRKSTRLNSSHITISYAVFCLKKKKKRNT